MSSLDDFTRIPDWVDPQRKLSLEAETWLQGLVDRVNLNESNLEWMYNLFLDVFVIVVKGGVRMTSPTPFADLGVGWQTLDLFDEEIITPTGITMDLGTNTFTVNDASEILFQISGAFSHNSLNDGRETFVRLYNVTKGTGGNGIPLGTGRNVEITSLAASTAFTVVADGAQANSVGDVFRVEIGGGAIYSAVEFETFSLTLTSIGPWLGARPEIPTS